MNAEEIAAQMHVPNFDHVYFVGRGGTRLTFQAQQLRALNLVWALSEKKILRENATVCVIGGGLSGMTAALACNRVGCNVTIMEESPYLMHLQRGSRLRFVHPNIYDWPKPTCKNPLTQLPILNWYAASASEIVDIVLQQWLRLQGAGETPITEILGREVTGLAAGLSPKTVVFATSGYSAEFDCVLVCTGFGLEKTLQPLPLLSYWENDNFSRTVLKDAPRTYLVSGCGDGGLIDALRLCVRDFDHCSFTHDLLSDDFRPVGNELIDIEQAAVKFATSGLHDEQVFARKTTGQNERSIRLDLQSEFLGLKYTALNVPDSLLQNLRTNLRQDTTVFLNGTQTTPYTCESSLLNRFALLCLEKLNKITYYCGRMEVESAAPGKKLEVSLTTRTGHRRTLMVDEAVIRHGIKSNLDKLFPRDTVTFLLSSISNDVSWLRHFPADFLRDPMLDSIAQDVAYLYAASNAFAFANSVTPSNLKELCIKRTDDETVFNVESPQPLEQTEFRQIKVVSPGATRTDASGRRDPQDSPDRPLHLGTEIGIWDREHQGWALFAVGCIVRDWDSRLGILTAPTYTHRLGARVIEPVTAGDQGLIGEVDRIIAPKESPYGASLSEGSIIFNGACGTLITLVDSIKAVNKLRDISVPKATRTIRPKKNLSVVTGGTEFGTVEGRVINIGAKIPVVGSMDGTAWYENAFECTSVSDVPLSVAAAMGSPVLTPNGSLVGLVVGLHRTSVIALPIGALLTVFNCALFVEWDIESAKREILYECFNTGFPIRRYEIEHVGSVIYPVVSIGKRQFGVTDERERAIFLEALAILIKEKSIETEDQVSYTLTSRGYKIAKQVNDRK